MHEWADVGCDFVAVIASVCAEVGSYTAMKGGPSPPFDVLLMLRTAALLHWPDASSLLLL